MKIARSPLFWIVLGSVCLWLSNQSLLLIFGVFCFALASSILNESSTINRLEGVMKLIKFKFEIQDQSNLHVAEFMKSIMLRLGIEVKSEEVVKH